MSGNFALLNGVNTTDHEGLWITDGTAGGTSELTGITGASTASLVPNDLTVFNGEFLFNGTDTTGNSGLWVSNGTSAGTFALTGITGASTNGLRPQDLTVFNGEALFDGADTTGNFNLWVSNGTAAGTFELTGITGASTGGLFNDPVFGAFPPDFVVLNNAVLFAAENSAGQIGLWETNGSAAGTFELTGISGANVNGVLSRDIGTTKFGALSPSFAELNGEVLFEGTDTAGNSGLWVSNGTAAGTFELTGISAGAPQDLTVFNGEVVFSAPDVAGNQGLWVSNGTTGGTFELTGISGANTNGIFKAGLIGTIFPGFGVFNNEVLFAGDDTAGQAGLWVSNGTAAGTFELTGINGASTSGIFTFGPGALLPDFDVLNGEALFRGFDTAGQGSLWATNGTVGGTFELTGISGANTSFGFAPGDITSRSVPSPGTLALFDGFDSASHYDLWVTDGTAAGTSELTGISGAATTGFRASNFTAFNGKVLFAGLDAAGPDGLWVTDGTAAGTSELTGISGAATDGIGFSSPVVFNGEVLFVGRDDSGGFNQDGFGLWVSNGTASGTTELTGISGANTTSTGLDPSDLTVFNGQVFFTGLDATSHFGLWASNGTAVGTLELTGISGANTASIGLDPTSLTVFNGELLLNGLDAAGNRGLWVSNGTAQGTSEITGIGGASTSGVNPQDLTVFNGEVLFNGTDAVGHNGLWVSNGTDAFELTGINGASTSGINPQDLTVFNGEVFFAGVDAAGQHSLWESNGTAAGTFELTGISGANFAGIFKNFGTFGAALGPNLSVFQGELFFNGTDAGGQNGLWASNGTAAGTFELTGITGALTTSGTDGLNPSTLTAVTPPTSSGAGPTLTGVATNAAWTEEGALTTLSPGVAVSDPSSTTLVGATVAIVAGTFANDLDVLAANTGSTGISANYNSASETLTLSGTDTLVHYQTVLDSVTFLAGENPTDFGSLPTRSVTWTVNDGNGASTTQTTTIGITTVNDPPTLANVASTANWTEDSAAATLSSAVTVSDADDLNLSSATVQIAGGTFAGDGDVLAATTTGTGIAASYNASTETLTLSGTDTVADYQSVLDSVTFSAGENPTNFGSNPTRTLTWTLMDPGGATNGGANVSTPVTSTVSITPVNDPPTLSNVTAIAAVTAPGQTITVSPLLAASDPDNLTLADATVAITGGAFAGDGDVLAATTTGTSITASYNSSTETLTLTGSDTLADYAQVLDSVTFDSTNPHPTNGGANPTRTVTWTANDGSGSNNLSAPVVTTISFAGAVPFDLNGDANSDLVFQNNGTPGVWLMNGATPIAETALPNPGATWHIVASRDVNGDGRADLIWQNSDGTPGIWLMNGTTPLAETGLSNPGADWHLVAAGDFNGDGKADLVWQDSDGTLGVWLMNGTTPVAEAGIGNPGANWRVVGTADYNADGRDDILLQNTVTGNLTIDLMNGTSVASSVSLAGDPSWHAVSTGVFNGVTEIAWQDNGGTPGLWLMNGTSPVAETTLPNPGAGWQLVSIDHFTQDGQADLLFQNTSGPLMLWDMNGTSVAAMVSPPNPGAGWQSVNGHPLFPGSG